MARTTICISKLVERTNEALKSTELVKPAKEALCTNLEGILHLTGNYNGFVFLYDRDEDTRPHGPTPNDDDYYNREYFLSHKLAKKRGFSS